MSLLLGRFGGPALALPKAGPCSIQRHFVVDVPRYSVRLDKPFRSGLYSSKGRTHGTQRSLPRAKALDMPRLEGDSALDPLAPLEDEPLVHEIAAALHFKKQREPFDNEYILGLVWQQRKHVVLATLCLILCTASNLLSPVLSGMLVEALVQQKSIEEYCKILGVLCFGYVLEPILTRVYMSNMLRGAEKVLATLRMELYRTLLMQRITFFDRHSAAELASLISVELDLVRSFIFSNVSRDRGLRAVLEMVGSVVVLFALSWRLAPVCSIVIVATAVAATIYRRKTRDVEQRQGKALQRMTGVALQALENMRTVRSFAGEALERERFQVEVKQSYVAGLQFTEAKAWFEASNRGAIHASLLALYAWGGWLVSHGLMPLRVMVSGIGFTFSLMYATQGTVSSLSELRRASGAFQRVRSLLVTSEPDPSMYGALPPGAWWEVANGREIPPVQPYADRAGNAAVEAALEGPLELRNIHFSYPVRPEVPVLSGLTLTMAKGTVTALVGRSGAGKSTVGALISRFYKPDQGGIYLAGRPALSFTRGEWSKAIALVSQDPVLFRGTIADNIAYGKYGKASQEDIQTAAQAANAHEFIAQLPDGYKTVVGDRGVLLSGGQRQRIAIARALLKDSPIIILDEATSALDSVSEAAVQQAVQRLVRGRTVLVIAHRLSTVQAADQIVVMAGGRVMELGTHAELSARPGSAYGELMRAQELILASV